MNEVLVSLVPLIGVIGVLSGAYLQGILNRQNQKASTLIELQNKAYSDFLNSVSKIAISQRKDKREEVEQELSCLADAKSRICVYGHSAVVQSLAEFLRLGGTLQTEQEINSFTNLCLEIRESVGMERKNLFASDISQLLFNIDVGNVKTPR